MGHQDTTYASLAALLDVLPESGPFVSNPVDGATLAISAQKIRDLVLTIDSLKTASAYGQLGIEAAAAGQILLAGVYEPLEGYDTEGIEGGGISGTKSDGRLTTSHAGDHSLRFAFSYSFATAADVVWQFAINGTGVGPEYPRKHANGNDVGNVGGFYTVPMVSGDYATVQIKTVANETITIEGGAFELRNFSA